MAYKNILDLLHRLGFNCETFSETIVVLGDEREYYISPLGVKLCGDKLVARIFKNTKLHKMVASHCRECSICVTSDPLLFYKAVLDRSSLRVIASRRVAVPSIDGCDAYVEGRVGEKKDKGLYTEISISPLDVSYEEKPPSTYNRAGPAIIEALVYITKIPYFEKSEQERFYIKILWCREIVYHSSTSELLRRIIDDIVARANNIIGREK